jgi:hypothetical protein
MEPSAGIVQSIHAYFGEESATLQDDFKIITLAVLAKAEQIPDVPDIIASFEDWLWLRLRLGADLATVFAELRSDQFPDGLMWGEIQMICDHCTEAAQWFLTRTGPEVITGFHIALALHVADLVRPAVISRHLAHFAQAVCAVNPTTAVAYAALVRDRAARIRQIAELAVRAENGASIFEAAASSRVRTPFELRTHALEEASRDIFEEEDLTETDEQRFTPPIAEILPPDEQRAVLAEAGAFAEQTQRANLARSFYRLAGDWESLITMECSLLSGSFKHSEPDYEILSDVTAAVNSYDEVTQNAHETYQYLTQTRVPVSSEKLETLSILVQLGWIRALMMSGRLDEGIAQFDQLDLFPTTRDQVPQYHEKFARLPPIIKEALPSWTFCLLNAYRKRRDRKSDDDTHDRIEALVAMTAVFGFTSSTMQRFLEGAREFRIFSS